MFKVFGSGVIILLTARVKNPLDVAELALIVMAICLVWTAAILGIRRRYAVLTNAEPMANKIQPGPQAMQT